MTNDALGYALNSPLDPSTNGVWGAVLNTQTSGHATELLTRSNNYSFADYELSRPLLRDYAEKITVNATASGAVALDYSASNHHSITLTGNVTSLTISNPPASGVMACVVLWAKQDGTGSRTLTYPAGWTSNGGVSPQAISSTADKTSLITAISKDGFSTALVAVQTGMTL